MCVLHFLWAISTFQNVLVLITFIKLPIQTLWLSLTSLFMCEMISLERSAAKTFGLLPTADFIFLSVDVLQYTTEALILVRSLITTQLLLLQGVASCSSPSTSYLQHRSYSFAIIQHQKLCRSCVEKKKLYQFLNLFKSSNFWDGFLL